MQTKFLIYIIIGILVVAGIAGASWYFVIRQPAPAPLPEEAPPPTVQQPEAPPGEEAPLEEVPVDETADWKVYRNDEHGFEIKYPKNGGVRPEWENYIELPSAPIYFPAGIDPEGERVEELTITPNASLRIQDRCEKGTLPIEEEKFLVGKVEFQKRIHVGVAAGSTYFDITYFFQNKKPFCLDFVFQSPSGLGVFYLPPIGYSEKYQQEIKQQEESFKEMTELILSTLRFLE